MNRHDRRNYARKHKYDINASKTGYPASKANKTKIVIKVGNKECVMNPEPYFDKGIEVFNDMVDKTTNTNRAWRPLRRF